MTVNLRWELEAARGVAAARQLLRIHAQERRNVGVVPRGSPLLNEGTRNNPLRTETLLKN
jgi:hypothetical protein